METDLPAVAAPGYCPVCGDEFLIEPRRCERCGTPHHPECWEYVPGCAVFGCADAPGLQTVDDDLAGWPRAHRLLVARTSLLTVAANALLLGLVAVAVGTPLHDLGFAFASDLIGFLFVLSTIAVPACAFAGLVCTIAMRLTGASAALEGAAAQGDRRLRRALDVRAGSLLPYRPSRLALAMGMSLLIPNFVELGAALLGAGVGGLGAFAYGMFIQLMAGSVLAAFWYPLVKLSAIVIGSQRIVANRFAASLPPPPDKPLLP